MVKKKLYIFVKTSNNPLQTTVWHEICASSNFCDFPSDPQNKFPQIKITAKGFPAKINFRLNIL